MSKDKLDFIFNRHSCRYFSQEPLREGDIELLMESLRWAPSAGNMQPWFFYVVKNEEVRENLAWAAYGQTFISEAPVVFVICADAEESASRYGHRGRSLYCIQDTAAAAENLLLSATALGYGSCWVGAFDEDRARRVFEIPDNLRPVAIIPVGYAKGYDMFTSRKSLERISKVVD